MSYSQSGEQGEILKYFGDRKGKFLDCGAYDGKTFSNTYQLILNGWTGVSIEASPVNFVNLQKLYIDLPVHLVCGALHTDTSNIVKFYESNGDAVGTTEEQNRERWAKFIKFQEIFITQFSVENLVNTFGTEFDFISIDTEGTSAKIFEKMIQVYSPDLWCVEFDDQIEKCVILAVSKGYKEIYRSGENIIFGK